MLTYFSLVSLIAITYIFYMGKTVIIPILLAFFFAVLLLPMAHFFNTKLRFPHTSRVNK
jgi:predicted PurR-regulated permease PerM